ncbi:MAG TPA: thiamine phosphate synthase [Nitrospira sp.]|nr:thiamine phosphate synthase [Nitrospira sp.]
MPSLESRLLLVTDRQQTKGRPLLSVLAQALRAGSPAIQLRERDLCAKELLALADEIRQLAGPRGSQLVINDRLDVALSVEGAGVHLRSDSLPLPVARRLIGAHRLLGVSVHSVSEAVQAEAGGADYVVFGPIYETPSKHMYGPPLGLSKLEEAARTVRVPIVGIGGVTAARARDVRAAGAFGVAVISAILGAEDAEAATRALLDALTSAS